MALLVSQVITSRDNEKVSLMQPGFCPAPNITKVPVNSAAFFHFSAINVQEDNQVCKKTMLMLFSVLSSLVVTHTPTEETP